MRQQINLYQPVFYEQRTPLSALTAVSVLAMVCLALALWQIYDGRQVAELAREVQIVRTQTQRQLELAGAVAAARATRGNPMVLQARARQLATELGARRGVLELLQNGAAGATGGFADRLEALARQHIDGVWLDHIVLGGAGGVSSISGHTLDPNLVPRYFQALAGEPALRGTRFDDFRIGEPPNPNAGSTAVTYSPGTADAPGSTDSQALQTTTPRATRFRASSVAPPAPQSKSSS